MSDEPKIINSNIRVPMKEWQADDATARAKYVPAGHSALKWTIGSNVIIITELIIEPVPIKKIVNKAVKKK